MIHWQTDNEFGLTNTNWAWANTKKKMEEKIAFDTLYTKMQEIGDICQGAIRDGEKGHRKAIHKIMKICQSVE